MSKKNIPPTTLWSCILGHGLELYDFTLYGTLTAFISLHFFSPTSSDHSFLLALIALSAGYIARPLGALLFGYIGDIYGRKKSLIFTIIFASLATGAIGLCPSYASIGIISSIVLFIARVIQGLCAGAETSDASVFLIEHCPPERTSYGSSMIFLSGGLGSLIAIFFSKVFVDLNFGWAWRIPFIIGFFVGGIVLYLRLNVKESTEFIKIQGKNNPLNFEFFYKLKNNHKMGLIKALSCGLLSGLTSTTIVVFVNLYLFKILNMNMEDALSYSFYGLVSFIFSCFMCRKIDSKKLRDKVITCSIIGLVLFIFPYFYLISTGKFYLIVFAQIILGIFSGSFIAPINAFLSDQFPPEFRCTGISVGYNTGYAITSGLYPIMAFQLIEITNNIFSPALFIFIFSILALLILNLKKDYHYVLSVR